MVTLKEGHELICSAGRPGFVRHPIYTGILTMFFATALVRGHLSNLEACYSCFEFLDKLGHEEKLMLQQFPERYAAYQHRAKRIIPFVL